MVISYVNNGDPLCP